MGSSHTRTRGILVEVDSTYVPERSEPLRRRWFFAYHIRIANQGEEVVQLISRHWIITDAHGEVEEVVGPGVVGEQPTLAPGEAFEYASFCPLPTPFGTMRGSYQMVTRDGEAFEVEIASFELLQPLPVN
ncbi:MAG: Co2+/Mg2+ efflux protein ApaG [Holophagae bacterium]|nr:MAG: Co2+/Mg2+ efflux protein ApaG [Holophagae bacterium]